MAVCFLVYKALQAIFCPATKQDVPQQQQQPPYQLPQQGQWQQQQPAPHPPAQHIPPQPKPPSAPYDQKPHRFNQDQVNHENPRYKDLRARANQAGDRMHQCFDQSHKAYENGDGAKAKELSNEGKEAQHEMDRLNKEAADWIFNENNRDNESDTIDLHGLYVKEAIDQTEAAINRAQGRGSESIHLVVGKGLHSPQHVTKLKPAIEELMQKYQLGAQIDPHNEGVLVVSLGGRGGRGLDPDDITRRLEDKDQQCIVM